MEITPEVHMFRSSGNYFLVGRDRRVLIDAGGKRNLGLLKWNLGRTGCRPGDIEEIVITHYHFDHAGCLKPLKDISGAMVSVGEDDAPFIAGEAGPERAKGESVLGRLQARFPGLLARYQRYQGVEPDRLLVEGDVIDCLGGLRVVETPGHSPGHISLYSPDRGIMFVGDVLFHYLGRLTMPFKDFTSDYERAKGAARKLADYDFEIACFGHGPPIVGEASRKIREYVRTI